jgi:hypothetical protein
MMTTQNIQSIMSDQPAHVPVQQLHTEHMTTSNSGVQGSSVIAGYEVHQQSPYMESMSDHITINNILQPGHEVQPSLPLNLIPNNLDEPIPMIIHTSNVGFQDNRRLSAATSETVVTYQTDLGSGSAEDFLCGQEDGAISGKDDSIGDHLCRRPVIQCQ